MDLEPQFERVGHCDNCKDIKISRISNDKFNVLGRQHGVYRVTVTAKRKNVKQDLITSNTAKVEVFSYVRVEPGDLLIYPGGRWTVQIEGGPNYPGRKQQIQNTYSIDDTSIAEVDQFGEILGKRIGDTYLNFKMMYHQGESSQVLAERKIKIRVRFVTSVEIIQAKDRTVFHESYTRLNTRLLHNSEVFLHAVGPVSYSWKSSTASYDLLLPSNDDLMSTNSHFVSNRREIWNAEVGSDQMFATNFNFSSISGYARQTGSSLVSVQLAIEYPDEYRSQKNWFDT